jgi:hypothetical protein
LLSKPESTLTFTLLPSLTSANQDGVQNPSEKPANCATGVFWHMFTDFSVLGRGIPLGLTRTYSSSDVGTNGP